MKVISCECEPTKKVEFAGSEINVPQKTAYLAVDSDGSVYAYTKKPELSVSKPGGRQYWKGHWIERVAEVGLENADWRKTLTNVKGAK